MTNRFYALALALLFTLAPVAHVSAATPAPADWSAVQSISPGEKVRVSTKDGDRLKGRFDSANDTDLSFTHEGRKVTLRRDTIKRVEVGHSDRLKGALVGAAIAGGAGAGTGTYLLSRTDHLTMTAIPAGLFIGAGAGAAVGAALGLGTNYDTVYEGL
jgi:ferric-dicitrate binding protein FerR (iron transport regulator)